MVVSLSPQTSSRNKPFKFLNMWMTHPKFLEIVRNCWQIPVSGTKQFALCMKLKALKQPLKILNKLDYSHISARTIKAHEDFIESQKQLLSNPNSTELKERMKGCRRIANFLVEAESQFLQQKLKTKHLMVC